MIRTMMACAAACAIAACTRSPDLDAPWTAAELELIASLALDGSGPPPSPTNRVADDPRAQALGRRLFFDKGLSGGGDVSCATCHDPRLYFTDARRTAKGRGPLPFNTPSVIGAAALPFVTWNGRHDSLWAQALEPLEHPREMNASRVQIARYIARAYRDEYQALFGPLPELDDVRFPAAARALQLAATGGGEQALWRKMADDDRAQVNAVFANVGKVLEAYQRTLWPKPSPFDRYAAALRNGDRSGGGHLSRGARHGLRLFIGQAGCVNCHHGPLFTDRQFHNVGLRSPPDGLHRPDRAEGAALVKRSPFRCGGDYSEAAACDELRFLNPSFEDHLGAYKTPSLRNVAMTGPYMHAGQLRTLEEVVEFYKRLPGQPSVGHREQILRPLGRSMPTRELVLFLRALTGPLPENAQAP